jgi:hypothetical protein
LNKLAIGTLALVAAACAPSIRFLPSENANLAKSTRTAEQIVVVMDGEPQRPHVVVGTI